MRANIRILRHRSLQTVEQGGTVQTYRDQELLYESTRRERPVSLNTKRASVALQDGNVRTFLQAVCYAQTTRPSGSAARWIEVGCGAGPLARLGFESQLKPTGEVERRGERKKAPGDLQLLAKHEDSAAPRDLTKYGMRRSESLASDFAAVFPFPPSKASLPHSSVRSTSASQAR